MYWRQSDPEGLALYNALESDASPLAAKVRRYLFINGSRFDLVDENKPFVGTTPMPPGHALYPPDLTRAQIEAYVAAHPGQEGGDLQRPHDRASTGRRPDRPAVSRRVQRVRDAGGRRRCAGPPPSSDDAAFANFLRLRADALLTDDYYKSDIAWLDLKDPKFDVIFAPYETYLDDLLGVKTSYGGAVLIRNEAESRKLAVYQQ